MGQTNMAAGATVGSNHNSRGADGELVAGRGFWPGLCVSVKHNSRFASFIIVAKGDYPAELDIPLPFSLVSNDVSRDELVVMPTYWFLHNMYALARNAWKYGDRDKRLEKIQSLEFDYLAPDSMQEIMLALEKLQIITARSWTRNHNQATISKEDVNVAQHIFSDEEALKNRENYCWKTTIRHCIPLIFAEGFENSSRKVRILKLLKAYGIYGNLLYTM
jgi:hypothetical protein